MPATLHASAIALLDESDVPYVRHAHEPVSSCESSAAIRAGLGIRALGSKNLLFSGKGNFFLVATHADARIRAKGFRSVTGAKDTRFATDQETADILGAESGSIPPLGFIRTDFPIFVDETILSAESYAFTPGIPTESVVLSGEALRAVFAHVRNPVYTFREDAEGYIIEPLSTGD